MSVAINRAVCLRNVKFIVLFPGTLYIFAGLWSGGRFMAGEGGRSALNVLSQMGLTRSGISSISAYQRGSGRGRTESGPKWTEGNALDRDLFGII